MRVSGASREEFQSLKGIWVNFDVYESSSEAHKTAVSIPKRDLGEFRLEEHKCPEEIPGVSIPKRDLGEFRPVGFLREFEEDLFQSLKGIWVNFDALVFLERRQINCFNP